MSSIKKIIAEKFGYTTDLPPVKDMHEDKGQDKIGKNPAYLPVEGFRKVVKLLMGATTTEEDGILENTIDFVALKRLANKYALAPAFLSNLNVMEVEFEKPKSKRDKKSILKAWDEIKENVPYWFLGMLPHKEKEKELPEDDKKKLTNLLEIMAEFNKESEKVGKENAKNTEHAGRDTEAKDRLKEIAKDHGDKARKETGSEKKLKDTVEEIKTEHKGGKEIEKLEKESAQCGPGDKKAEELKKEDKKDDK